MSKDPAALLYIDNWLISTKEMKADERGWYLNLILHQYDKGDLPNDIEELANMADVRISEYSRFEQAWEQVLKPELEKHTLLLAKNPEQKGTSHWNWKGGISTKNNTIRASSQYANWRRNIFLRDHFTCRLCGKDNCAINAHHIKHFSKYPALRFDIDNGITLCKKCHIKIHTTKNK